MIIFLNGPPGVGKDTAATIIRKKLISTIDYKLSRPLKRGIQNIFMMSPEVVRVYEADKDAPSIFLGGMSYREAQIKLFKDFIVPNLGPDGLAELAKYGTTNAIAKHITVSDAGLTSEVAILVKHFTKAKCCLIEIERPGHSFDDDIREWISPDLEFMYRKKINNQHDLELFELQIERTLKEWKLLKDG